VATEITYKCDLCGKDFISHRVRKGSKYCKACVEDLRKKGQGPVQLVKAGTVPTSKAEVTAGAKVEAEKVEKPTPPQTPEGKSLSQLAQELREKYAKQGKKPEAKAEVIGEKIENVE